MNQDRAFSQLRSETDDPDGSCSATRLVVARPRATLALHDVVITGLGVILPNCDTRASLWSQLHEGRTQLGIEPDPADGIACAIGRVRNFDCRAYLPALDERHYASCPREQQFYLASLAQAVRDAGLGLERVRSARTGLFDGTSRGSFAAIYEMMQAAERNGRRFTLRELNLAALPGQAVGIAAAILGVKGPTYTFNGTCSAGAIAIGSAFRELQAGRIDVAFATGHDAALVAPLFQVYRDSNLISREAHDPECAIRPLFG